MQLPDGFVPVPHHPAFLVHPDGRVLSLKKSPPALMAEKCGKSVWRRVKVNGVEVRVRDLVWLTFGTVGPFQERCDAESEAVA